MANLSNDSKVISLQIVGSVGAAATCGLAMSAFGGKADIG
jgi:hypothetical protein